MRKTSRSRRWRDRLTAVVAALGAVALTAGFLVVGVSGSVSAEEVVVPGNNGTLKVHEEGTPSGTEDNDPKVCVFNIEGFDFDVGQQLKIRFDVQGGSEPVGVSAGPFGPYTADEEGYFATEYFNLANGTYKSTALGKDTPDGDYNVDLKAKSKVFKVECEPQPTTGSLQWLKVEEGTEVTLDGATFQVCPPEGGDCYPVTDNAGLDEDPDAGEFLLTELELGTYTVTETVAPEGYVAVSAPKSATLTENEPDQSLGAFENRRQQQGPDGTLRWLKYDDHESLLGGATFEVCLAGNGCFTVVDDGERDSDKTPGEFQVEDLALGTWTIDETAAPTGYRMDSSVEPVVLTVANPSNVDGDPEIPAFVNVRIPPPPPPPTGTLQWLKVDEAGDPLAGATFEVCLTGGTCLTVVDDSAPDVNADDGEFELRNLTLGTYTITEVEAPDGYVRDFGSETVVLSDGTPANTGDAIPEFVNLQEEEEVVYGDLGWLKVDEGGEPLAGATFEVCHVVDINGNDLADDCAKVTDNKAPDTDPDAGELALADVPLGAWTIEETKAPKGYEMSDEVAEVVLTEADASNIGDVDMPEFVNVLIDIEDEEAEEPEVKPAEEDRPKPAQPVKPAPVVQPDQVAGAEAALPTTVDAGLAGPTNTGGSNSPLGQSLMAAGLVLMALAGVMKVGRRERGVHEA